jgi:hypothetical protein
MKSLYRYFKLLFSDDEELVRKWNQLSDGKASEKYRQAVAKELQKREYRYDGARWIKSSG